MNPVHLAFGIIFFSLLVIVGVKLLQQISSLTGSELKRFLLVLGGSLAVGFVLLVLADTYARVTVGDEGIGDAVNKCLHYRSIQPFGTTILLFPFAVIGWITATFSKGSVKTLCLLIGGFVPATWQYFSGYIKIQTGVLRHAWTASALEEGFLPFFSLPFIGIGMIIVFILWGKSVRPKK